MRKIINILYPLTQLSNVDLLCEGSESFGHESKLYSLYRIPLCRKSFKVFNNGLCKERHIVFSILKY